jgi:hypothetical protein
MRRALRHAALLALLGLGAAGAGLLYLQAQGVAPRALAPYLEKRSSGHNPLVSGAGQWLGASLMALDRGALDAALLPPLTVGAQPAAAAGPAGAGPAGAPAARRLVASVDAARAAFAAAAPGDAIVFLPGTYRITGSLAASRPGEQGAPITVRAEQPGTVTIEFDATEGFVVSAPYWRFENMTIRGACAQHASCEHAFHVVGAARHFAAVNNTILDFNAHFKINGVGGLFPDQGLVEANTLSNSSPRQSAGPVTPIDLVAASDWTIRRNLITDFVKAEGDRISYGAFAKGGGARTLFEHNVVLCEQRLRGAPGQRVGLSFGGGGTGKPYCRDRKCITEHDQGTMRANLVASCSDAGIYVNSGAASSIVGNTLVDTGGVQVRFPESSADIDGNLVDGAIYARNGARLRLGENLVTPIAAAYLGLHPLRSLFRAPQAFDFGWRDGAPPAVPPGAGAGAGAGAGLCGAARPAYGAFEQFGACLR